MKVLFLDESGDHNLSVIDPQYPVFVLGGIIMDKEYAEGPLTEALNEFKHELFGSSDIILHTADIARNRNGFEPLIERDFRNRFYNRLNNLMRNLPYTVVACVIRKDRHLGRYGIAAIDPYLLSLNVLVERFCYEVGDAAKGGVVVAERRDPTSDRELELAWLGLINRGTRFLRGNAIENRLTALDLRAKKENIAGLQLADLVASPIGRHVIGKPDKEDWDIVYQKFRRNRQGE